MKILGIDPGSALMGYGVIKKDPTGKLLPLDYGVLKITEKTIPQKLLSLSKQLDTLLEKTKPDAAGVEQLFFAKNKKTAIEVAHARGVIIMKLLEKNIPLYEFTPPQVKIAVTGYGLADKIQIASMTAKILGLEKIHADDNASDGLAVAIATSTAINNPLNQ